MVAITLARSTRPCHVPRRSGEEDRGRAKYLYRNMPELKYLVCLRLLSFLFYKCGFDPSSQMQNGLYVGIPPHSTLSEAQPSYRDLCELVSLELFVVCEITRCRPMIPFRSEPRLSQNMPF